MSLRKFDKIQSFEDVKRMHEDHLGNLSFDDLNAGDLKTVAPTTDTLSKGKFRLVEESGVPVLYYRNLSGSIYKQIMTAV